MGRVSLARGPADGYRARRGHVRALRRHRPRRRRRGGPAGRAGRSSRSPRGVGRLCLGCTRSARARHRGQARRGLVGVTGGALGADGDGGRRRARRPPHRPARPRCRRVRGAGGGLRRVGHGGAGGRSHARRRCCSTCGCRASTGGGCSASSGPIRRSQHLPVVVFTADMSARGEAPAELRDGDVLITKPFQADDLLRAVQTAVGRLADAGEGRAAVERRALLERAADRLDPGAERRLVHAWCRGWRRRPARCSRPSACRRGRWRRPAGSGWRRRGPSSPTTPGCCRSSRR